MKKTILTMAVMALSNSAFAMHAYGEDHCIAQMMNGQTLEISLQNGGPADSHIIVDGNGGSNEPIYVEFRGAPVGGNEDGGTLVLQSKGDKNVLNRKTDDGCFQGFERTSTRQATVISASKELAKKYGLSKKTVLNFVCYTSASAPVGNNCN